VTRLGAVDIDLDVSNVIGVKLSRVPPAAKIVESGINWLNVPLQVCARMPLSNEKLATVTGDAYAEADRIPNAKHLTSDFIWFAFQLHLNDWLGGETTAPAKRAVAGMALAVL
jgi:hypothetical protein